MNPIKIYTVLLSILFISTSINGQNDNYPINEIIISKIPEKTTVIGLGDPTHQESTITKYRVDLIKKLVEEKDFSIIALEGNMYELYKAYQKFIETNEISYIEDAMYSQLNIAEIEDLYQYVYEEI